MEKTNKNNGEYWSTLSEYHHDEDFQERVGEEFFPEAKPERFFESEDSGEEQPLTAMKRRTFLKLGSFAALAAALQGCERPVEKVLPYQKKPDEITLGVPNFYTSTFVETGEGYGILVKSREGRPVKLEGNPRHPLNEGSLDSRAQATLLDLYNPDRLRFPMRVNRHFEGEVGEDLAMDRSVTMEVLDQEVGMAIKNAKGKVVFLTQDVHGPSNDRLFTELKKEWPDFEVVYYNPLQPGASIAANKTAFGIAARSRYEFDKARVVVCLGGDPLGQGVSALEYQRGFASRRSPEHPDGMSQVFCFEPTPTLTGMKADYRYPVRPDHLIDVALCLVYHLVMDPAIATSRGEILSQNADLTRLLASYTPEKVAESTGVSQKELFRSAKGLADNPGKGIVYTGGLGSAVNQGEALQLAVALLNDVAGNMGETIDLEHAPSNQGQGTFSRLPELASEMKAGKVSVLIYNNVNPVYSLPASLEFVDALDSVGMVVSLGRMMDESSALADVILPGLHGLECWGDAEPQKGLYSIQQPAIRRIFGELAKNQSYNTRCWQESLIAFATAAGSKSYQQPVAEGEGTTAKFWYDYVRETWDKEIYKKGKFAAKDFDKFWISLLQQGVLDLREKNKVGKLAFRPQAITSIKPPIKYSGPSLVLYGSQVHGDGVSMGNPILLELPDPVSRVCWDNYVVVPPVLAREMKLRDGDHLSVATGAGKIELPVFIQPGTHPDVVAVMTGWGRNAFGGIGDGLGANAWSLAEVKGDSLIASGIDVSIEKTENFTKLANVQGHNYLHSPEHGGVMVNARHGEMPENAQKNEEGNPVYDRAIIGETTLNEWKKNHYAGYPNHVEPGENPPSMWGNKFHYEGHHWGMVVDMTSCIGCNACMTACSVENNVPIVGKDEVLMGREMHWIRIDRYYRGDEDNPDFTHQPVMCQHCDNAPCETVCPVIATMHNDEGLNVMAYNRCVGTRYCANNCPYKVRRFNFWQYSDYRTGPHEGIDQVSPLELLLNPDVTTRTKGVMEKCTFCISRIRSAKDKARTEGRTVQDSDMQTACQQTCPAKAITFGDRNNPDSQVAKDWKDERSYGLLADLNVDPSVRYKTLVRNREEPSPYRTIYQAHREDHRDESHGSSHETDDSNNGH